MDTIETVSTSEDGHEATFRISDLPRGFGHTIGNGLRRTLQEGISGVAVTNVRFEGAHSSFGNLPGVPEDILEIKANLKSARFRMAAGIDDVVIDLVRDEPGAVTTGSLELPEGLEAVDPDHLLFSIDPGGRRSITMAIRIRRGIGYVDEKSFRSDDVEDLPLDANFSPVARVQYAQEDARPGVTTGETVTITVRTDGSRPPLEVLREAAALGQLQWSRISGDVSAVAALLPARPVEAAKPRTTRADSERSISELEAPQRLENTLVKAGYETLEKLRHAEPRELLRVRNFGKRSLIELRDIMVAKGFAEDVAGWEEAAR